MLYLTRQIEIASDVENVEFLIRLTGIIPELGSYRLLSEGECSWDCEDQKLEFSPQASPSFKNLRALLIAPRIQPNKVEVRLSADRWTPDLVVYVSTARELINPILKLYNRRFVSRLRLRTPIEYRPRHLPPGARELFDPFASLANKGCLHPIDMGRFYRFAIYCHDCRVALNDEDLEQLLLRGGFCQPEARDLAILYRHFREILRLQHGARFDRAMARYAKKKESEKGITPLPGRPASPSAR